MFDRFDFGTNISGNLLGLLGLSEQRAGRRQQASQFDQTMDLNNRQQSFAEYSFAENLGLALQQQEQREFEFGQTNRLAQDHLHNEKIRTRILQQGQTLVGQAQEFEQGRYQPVGNNPLISRLGISPEATLRPEDLASLALGVRQQDTSRSIAGMQAAASRGPMYTVTEETAGVLGMKAGSQVPFSALPGVMQMNLLGEYAQEQAASKQLFNTINQPATELSSEGVPYQDPRLREDSAFPFLPPPGGYIPGDKTDTLLDRLGISRNYRPALNFINSLNPLGSGNIGAAVGESFAAPLVKGITELRTGSRHREEAGTQFNDRLIKLLEDPAVTRLSNVSGSLSQDEIRKSADAKRVKSLLDGIKRDASKADLNADLLEGLDAALNGLYTLTGQSQSNPLSEQAARLYSQITELQRQMSETTDPSELNMLQQRYIDAEKTLQQIIAPEGTTTTKYTPGGLPTTTTRQPSYWQQ